MAFHSKDELIAYISSFRESLWRDGVIVDCPKRRRRSEAMGKKMIRIRLDADLQRDFMIQVERRMKYGKDLTWRMIADRLAEETDDDLEERLN